MSSNLKPYRATLAPNIEHVFDPGDKKNIRVCTVMNLGKDEVFINYDDPAVVNGADSILIIGGMALKYENNCKTIHLISASNPQIQILYECN